MKKIVRRSGFTLPEVLVTVTVVAVLAAVVVPAVTQYVGRGNGPASEQDIIQIRNAVTGFIVDTRVNPANLNDLTKTTAPAYATLGGGTWHGPYLSSTVGTGTAGATGQGLLGGSSGAGTASFVSNGVGISLADTILTTATTTAGGALEAVVISPTACGALAKADSLIDDGVGATGNFRFYGTCATATSTADSARLIIATVGKP